MSITDTRTPPTIKPAKVNDAKEIYQLARDIWFLHYPGLITIKQIEYMLEQKYTVNKKQRTPNYTKPFFMLLYIYVYIYIYLYTYLFHNFIFWANSIPP